MLLRAMGGIEAHGGEAAAAAKGKLPGLGGLSDLPLRLG